MSILHESDQPAFPTETVSAGGRKVFRMGLSKREFFAAKAMQVMFSDPDSGHDYQTIADDAVKLADALIEALNK